MISPDCENLAVMVKLPTNLPFSQDQKAISKNSKVYSNKSYCHFCGENIPEKSKFCNTCGAKQD